MNGRAVTAAALIFATAVSGQAGRAADSAWAIVSPFARGPAFRSPDPVDALLDAPEQSAESIWEQLILPPGSIYLRARATDVTTSPYPAHYLRAEYARNRAEIGALIARDDGERNGADLLRAGIEYSTAGTRLVAGDFRVDHALGWTVASTPAWASPTDPRAALRTGARGVRRNLSSEEGRGWRGAAVSYDPNGESSDTTASSQSAPFSADIWAGVADYDARAGANGGFVPYSVQGDHRERRTADLETLRCTHAGARFGVHLPARLGEFEAIGVIDRFEAPIDADQAPARFRIPGRRFSAFALAWSHSDPGRKRVIEAEATRQSTGAYAGAIVAGTGLGEANAVLASAWRATLGFASLHARPYLAFGTDPAGRTGGQLNWVHKLPGDRRLAAGVAVDVAEPAAGSQEQTRALAHLTYETALAVNTTLRLQAIEDASWEPGGSSDSQVRGRALLRREQGANRIDLRGELSRGEHGAIGMLSFGVTNHGGEFASVRFAVTGILHAGRGVAVSVIEPDGPGRFPVRRVSGSRLRAAARVDVHPLAGLLIWLAARAESRLSSSAPNTGAQTPVVSAGIDWFR